MYINWGATGAVLGGVGNLIPQGANLTKGVTAAWDNYAFGVESFTGDGHVEVTYPVAASAAHMFGLAYGTPETAPHYSDPEAEFMIYGDAANYQIYENGAFVTGIGTVPANDDVVRVSIEAGVLKYYVNGVLKYTSLRSPTSGREYHPVAMIFTANKQITGAKLVDSEPATTAVNATITVEMKTGAGASAWTTIPDVIAKFGIGLEYGMSGAGFKHRIAGTGVMDFVVDNSEGNASGAVGRYTPGHANQWGSGGSYPFDLGAEVRLKVESLGAEPYYKFRGHIDDLDIIPGKYREGGKKVRVRVVDFMDQCARASVSGIAVQQNKRSDELFSTILAAMDTQPAGTQVGYGQDTYPYALDNTRDESISVMTEFTRLALSEFGYVFVKGDNVQGGTLVFENRLKRGQKTAAVTSLTDLQLTDMPVSYGRDDVLNNVQVQIYPRRIDAAATTVLFTLQNTPEIKAGTTLELKGAFRDPSSGSKTRVGGIEMVNPVITTDYKLTANEDGTGTDLSSQLTVTPTFSGNAAELSIANAGPEDGYLFLMQCRGKGLYAHESVLFEKADATSQTKYGDNQARVSLPYQSNSVIGEEIAYYVLSQNKNAAIRVLGATFVAQDSAQNMTDAINREISDRIAIKEPITAVDTEYFINAVRWDISPGGIIRCSWTLAPASLQEYWILETAGYTELDQTTVLAYGLFAPQWQLDVSNLGVDTTVNAV